MLNLNCIDISDFTVLPAQWRRGDGTGGPEVRIGVFANKEVYYAKCSVRRKNGKLINGATVDSRTKKTCYCEFGMRGRNKNRNWITTFIKRGMDALFTFLWALALGMNGFVVAL